MSGIHPVVIGIGFFAIWLFLWLPIAYPIALRVGWRPFQPSLPSQKILLLLPLYGMVPLLLWGITRLNHTSFKDYGWLWPQLLRSFGWGGLIAAVSLLLLFLLQYRLGWLARSALDAANAANVGAANVGAANVGAANVGAANVVTWRQQLSTVIAVLGLAVWISGTEELVFRGFLQTQLQQAWPIWLAAVIASGIFAILHGVWEGARVIPQLPGLWLMGMVLVLARLVDQNSLGLAWGLHTGWVWVIASLDSLGWLQFTPKAPAWLTGINQQPIAGVLSGLFLSGTAVGLWLLFGSAV
ncbi:MAG: CPBP family intramembrane metalloprotease [Elainella sp. Prado103]|nr:CPBP family intramembrane metalloprotease [Elainella sp. Prado103]